MNMIEFTGRIILEVCITTAFPHFDLSNFLALNYRKDIADRDVVDGPTDSKQWGADDQEQSCPMAFRDSLSRKCGIQFLNQCD